MVGVEQAAVGQVRDHPVAAQPGDVVATVGDRQDAAVPGRSAEVCAAAKARHVASVTSGNAVWIRGKA